MMLLQDTSSFASGRGIARLRASTAYLQLRSLDIFTQPDTIHDPTALGYNARSSWACGERGSFAFWVMSVLGTKQATKRVENRSGGMLRAKSG